MEENKFKVFCDCFEEAFLAASNALLEVLIEKRNEQRKSTEERRFCVVVGVVGTEKIKGRILLEADGDTAKMVAERINDEPIDNAMDIYFIFSEYANIICGNAVTKINNRYRGTDLKLTPPAIFSGSEMQVVTPEMKSQPKVFTCELGTLLMDVGFEGV